MSGLLLALALAQAAPPIPIDAAEADWAGFPRLERAARPLPTAAMVTQVERILRSGGCRLVGQSPNRFSIDVPFAVLLDPDAQVLRVIVRDMNCAPLEGYVGQIVLELARQGDFRSTAADAPIWYGDSLSFTLR